MARPRSDLAPRILAAARKRFLLEGVDGASLRGIASDAGTTIGMVYYYYATKDDLFLAVVEDVYEEVLNELEAALANDVPVEERFERIYLRIAAMSDVEFDVVRIILREAMISSTRLQRLIERGLRGHLPWLLSAIAEGRSNGRLDPTLSLSVELVSIMSLGILPQLLLRRARDSELALAANAPSAEETARQLARILRFGIAGPALKAEPREPPPTDAPGGARARSKSRVR